MYCDFRGIALEYIMAMQNRDEEANEAMKETIKKNS